MQSLITILHLLFLAMTAPAVSGVVVVDESPQVYKDIKDGKLLYAIYTFNSPYDTITVDTKEGNDKTFADFVAELKNMEARNECLFAVYNLKFTAVDGAERKKLVFFVLIPDRANLKQKMICSGNTQTVRRALGGTHEEFIITDIADLTLSNVVEKLRTK